MSPNYSVYPKSSDMPRRLSRKAERNRVFQANRKAGKLQRTARREARRAALDGQNQI